MYFPKSQIISNLSTNGGEFILSSTRKPYTGKYFSTSDGRFYTGATPQDGNNQELLKKPNLKPKNRPNGESDYDTNISRVQTPQFYQAISNSPGISLIPPKGEITLPTGEDYDNYEYLRYFLQHKVKLNIIEVSEHTYINYFNKNPKTQYQLYTPIKINWVLVGKPIEVYNINKNIVLLYESKNQIKGMFRSFKGRYLKYYKENKKQFYSTTGGELKVKDTGENYVGFYHIHTNRGVIMEGRFHTSTPHSILIPFKGKKEEQNLQLPILDREVGTSIRKNISRGSGY